MKCPEFVDLLSSRLDGELTAAQRARLETHLQACAECRRRGTQMQRAVAWLHGLERLPAPLRDPRLARRPRLRRSAWPALRPLALAASAVLAALLAWEGFDALVAPARFASSSVPTATPVGESSTTRGPAAGGPATEPPRPGSSTTPAIPAPVVEPGFSAGGVSHGAATPTEEPPPAAALSSAADPTGDEPAYARIQGNRSPGDEWEHKAAGDEATSSVPSPARDGAAPTAQSQSAPIATTVWVIQPVTSEPPPTATVRPGAGASRPSVPAGTGRSQAGAIAAPPAPAEVAISLPVVAWIDADAIRFAAPGEAAPTDRIRTHDATVAPEGAALVDLSRRGDELSRPDADPRTGVTAPVPLERPMTVLPVPPDPELWRLLPPFSLQVTVAADGQVVSVIPLPWPGPAPLAEALAESVRGWTFRPAERAGAAIAARLEVAIEFDAR